MRLQLSNKCSHKTKTNFPFVHVYGVDLLTLTSDTMSVHQQGKGPHELS